MKSIMTLFAVLLCAACQPAALPHPVIVAHVDAFNAKDIPAMSAVEHPEVEWFSVEGDTITVEVKGRAQLADMMTDYLEANPTVTGSLRDWSINGDFISVTETATWQTADGTFQSQSALTVYEMDGDLIRRVWYYPAVRP